MSRDGLLKTNWAQL